jgi:hypothetical protein
MAALHAISPHGLLSLSETKKTISKSLQNPQFLSPKLPKSQTFCRNKQSWHLNSVVQEELDVIPVQSGDSVDQQEGMLAIPVEREGTELAAQVSGFGGSDGQFSFEGFSSASSSGIDGESIDRQSESERLIDRTINAMIVLGAGTYAITKLLTIDHNYWHVSTILYYVYLEQFILVCYVNCLWLCFYCFHALYENCFCSLWLDNAKVSHFFSFILLGMFFMHSIYFLFLGVGASLILFLVSPLALNLCPLAQSYAIKI